MQEKQLYEYAVIRLVPRVQREEFLNIGVILFCAKAKFLEVKFDINIPKLALLDKDLDFSDLEKHLNAFNAICKGLNCGSPIAALDLPSRFRWLTAKRSTIIQTSSTHSGLSDDLENTLNLLFQQLVL